MHYAENLSLVLQLDPDDMTTSRSLSTSRSASTYSLKRYFLPCLGVTGDQRHKSAPDDFSSPCTSDSVTTPCKRDRRIVSLESGRLLLLTNEDLDTISSLWEKVPNKHLWSQRLFLKIFSLKPSFLKIMRYDGMPTKQVMQCDRFQAHCNRFIDFWDQLIFTLSDSRAGREQTGIAFTANARVVGQIRAIGKMHCGMPGVTFDAESWLLFKNVLLESVCGQRRPSLKSSDQDKGWVSWCKLVTFVVSEMKDAFNEGIRTRSNTL